MRAACILTLAIGLTLAAPANAQFSYPAHGPRTLGSEETGRPPQATVERGFHLLDPASGPPAPGYHLLDPPSVAPMEPTTGYYGRSQAATADDRPARRSQSYNQRPPDRATRQAAR